MIATPAGMGGANMDQIRKLAGRTMLTSTIVGVPQEVASREMAGLLSGRAGAHNILGARLGLLGGEAEKFNKMAPEARLAKINSELDKYQGAADKFGQSFIAQFTTLKDNLKYSLLAESTSPLFEHVKRDLSAINGWFDHNQQRVQAFTNVVGRDLAGAWDKVASTVASLEPLIGKAVDRLLAPEGVDRRGLARTRCAGHRRDAGRRQRHLARRSRPRGRNERRGNGRALRRQRTGARGDGIGGRLLGEPSVAGRRRGRRGSTRDGRRGPRRGDPRAH